jgi:hypothetical protein
MYASKRQLLLRPFVCNLHARNKQLGFPMMFQTGSQQARCNSALYKSAGPRPPFCLGSPRAAGGAAGHLMDNPEYSIDNGVVSAAPPPGASTNYYLFHNFQERFSTHSRGLIDSCAVVCHVKSSRGVDFEAMQVRHNCTTKILPHN